MKIENLTTVEDCQNFCVGEEDCFAVDFNFKDDSCWLHYCARDLFDSNTYTLVNTTQYRLNRTCQEVTTGQSI